VASDPPGDRPVPPHRTARDGVPRRRGAPTPERPVGIDVGTFAQVGETVRECRAGDESWIPANKKHRLACNAGSRPLTYPGVYPARAVHDYGAIAQRNLTRAAYNRRAEVKKQFPAMRRVNLFL
jgi:hypothetical protein